MCWRILALFALAISTVASAISAPVLVDGRFGKALDAQVATLTAPGQAAYSTPPLTVELWARLRTLAVPQVFVASEAKESGTHWELFTFAGERNFSAYLPGYTPAITSSQSDLADLRWHHLAMTFDGQTVRLYVDAKEVATQRVERKASRPRRPGPLTIGTVRGATSEPSSDVGALGCSCELDDVRISKGILPPAETPRERLRVAAGTLALWSMDRLTGETVVDSSPNAVAAQLSFRRSMDDLDRVGYKAGPAPMFQTPVTVTLHPGRAAEATAPAVVSLDGEWQMAEAGEDQARLSSPWSDAIPAQVPGSVHAALTKAGRIPDPKFALNDKIAHDKSFEPWWFHTTFPRPSGMKAERLVFDGVAIRGTIWLNGKRLGTHEGMFGGPEYPIAGLLKDQNEIIVKLDAAPGKKERWSNSDWRRTVVFNNVWGWHYSSIPALGIWRAVRVEGTPSVRILHPFLATQDAAAGVIDLWVELKGASAQWSGKLVATIEPDNFKGAPYQFTHAVTSTTADQKVRLRFRIPDPKLWWPNDIGEQNLYKATLAFVSDSGSSDRAERIFGIRTVEMRPQPDGPRPDRYNWTFLINGRPMFVKGSNWCTMDSSMDFSRQRYDRFLSVAKLQHVQMLRAWGSGMPETDDFYDLCDRKGIMVLQEWPTAWDSHNDQPYDMLEETVRLNTLRIRNHPALVMYAGGNESPHPFGPAIDMMGRYAIELDGTRTFHRGEPWGGSDHKYDPWWGYAHLDFFLNATAEFWGEFGIASLPLYESVQRYLPEDEKNVWPPKPGGALQHHTPIFNTADDWSRLQKMAGYFTAGATLEDFVRATQMAQATGVRHALERARTQWPNAAGALYYKMNDNYPAASWSTADWYGAMKLSHFVIQDAFNPLLACALFRTVNSNGQAVSTPIVLVDDRDELKGVAWKVIARAFDAELHLVKQEEFNGSGAIPGVKHLGALSLTPEQTDTAPLLTVVEVHKAGALAHRVFYWTNYEAKKDSLFTLPQSALRMQAEGRSVTVTNTGNKPAVGVHVDRPGHMDSFTVSDGYFWLDPGESKTVDVNDATGLTVSAWNVSRATDVAGGVD